MADNNRKRSSRKNSKAKSQPQVQSSPDTKTRTKKTFSAKDSARLRSVGGLLLFAAGVMFFLAVLTYSQTDPVLSSNVPQNKYVTQNVLGLVGATVAQPVFVYIFGYASLIFPMLMMFYGIYILMNQPLNKLARLTALGLSWAYFVAIVLAIPESPGNCRRIGQLFSQRNGRRHNRRFDCPVYGAVCAGIYHHRFFDDFIDFNLRISCCGDTGCHRQFFP
ncbi:MAG: DNA translocase FtsK 4TM domain-containing protein [Calditrichaeota bacterium]|nr:DNA translocase FtsK 4TM domain-containing protein [Calditrichota bacterium]